MGYLFIVLHGVLLAICVGTWWKAGQMEDPAHNLTSLVWSGLSGLLFLSTWLILGWGWFGIIAAQFALGLGIAVLRTARYMYQTREKS